MSVSADQIFHLNEPILFTVLQEEGVLFHLDNRMVHTLNRTGTGIVRLLDGLRSVKEVTRALSLIYEQPEAVLQKDVEHFLSNLYERGWIDVKRTQHVMD